MRRPTASVLLALLLATLTPGPLAAQGDLTRARQLQAEAQRHWNEGRYREGIPRAQEALALREQALGPAHPEVAETLHTLASLLRDSDDYAGARRLFERALPAAGRAGALQQAQRAVLADPATAHPYYWAPFILIGAR